MLLADGDLYEGEWPLSGVHTFSHNLWIAATLYAAVSASFIIEQRGLPTLRMVSEKGIEEWNNDLPQRRVDALRQRHVKEIHYKHH